MTIRKTLNVEIGGGAEVELVFNNYTASLIQGEGRRLFGADLATISQNEVWLLYAYCATLANDSNLAILGKNWGYKEAISKTFADTDSATLANIADMCIDLISPPMVETLKKKGMPEEEARKIAKAVFNPYENVLTMMAQQATSSGNIENSVPTV